MDSRDGKGGLCHVGREHDPPARVRLKDRLLLFDGDPAADVKILGERSRIKAVYVGGRAIDLEDRDPPRRPIAGWRTSAYSDAILRRRDVLD